MLKQKVIPTTKAILAILFEIGALHIKAFFPHPYYHTFCRHKSHRTFNTSLYRLRKKGIINYDKKKRTYYLNEKNYLRGMLANWEIRLETCKLEKRWDGHWRILIFDIPEELRRFRDYLRDIIKVLGFRELQKSVWISPFKPPKFVLEPLNDNRIKRFVRFMEISKINYDIDLRKKFKIK